MFREMFLFKKEKVDVVVVVVDRIKVVVLSVVKGLSRM